MPEHGGTGARVAPDSARPYDHRISSASESLGRRMRLPRAQAHDVVCEHDLGATLEAIGPVRVELWVRASSPYFDVFSRVCDVEKDGASWNVCDALARVAPGQFEQSADGAWRVPIDLWPIAHRFAAGHRIRLQVSSGAHPRYPRKPGTGEDPLTASTLRAVEIEVLRGKDHPSVLILPATAATAGAYAAVTVKVCDPPARTATVTSTPRLVLRTET